MSKVAPQSDDSVVVLIQTKILKTVLTHVVKVVVIIIIVDNNPKLCKDIFQLRDHPQSQSRPTRIRRPIQGVP